jgi:hypothetical protein
MFNNEQINYILYNNRTFEGVVKNFMPDLKYSDIQTLLEINKQLRFINNIITKDTSIIIDRNKLDLNVKDIEIYPQQLEKIKVSSRNFSIEETSLLNNKKIQNSIIEKYDISSLSNIKDNDTLNILGVITHPILEKLIGNGISDGLIIPLYKDNNLINSVFRKTNNITKLKYGITVPSINLWGDNIENNKEIWLTEGLFDMMAIRENNKSCVSASSCSLSDYNYFQIIKNNPKCINIFTDNDISGYRSSLRSKKLFNLNGIESHIYCSKKAKDPAEHFFELDLDWSTVDEIKITTDMINKEEEIFDFLNYLENRKF